MLRSLLRHIALGTPLVLGPAGILVGPTLLGCGRCPGPHPETAVYTYESSAGGETLSCEAVCADFTHDGDPIQSCSFRDTHTVACVTMHAPSCGAGRLPLAGARRRTSPAGAVRTRWLLDTATLELAAVPAFAELGRALAAHAAPVTLVRGARRALADEVRHARTLAGLAARDCGRVRVEAAIDVGEVPALEALALHNAAEGCVREALGAFEAAHQAQHAPDAALRRTMGAIARDEARHALLSLDVDAWLRTRLPASTRRRMDTARDDAARALAASDDGQDAAATLARAVGLPAARARAQGLALVAPVTSAKSHSLAA